MANGGVSKLAQVIAERIASQTQRPDALELGTIQPDMSLKLDRFAVPIPKGEYLVADWTLQIEIPIYARVIRIASPVNPDGTDIPEVTGYSQLSRFDFHVLSDLPGDEYIRHVKDYPDEAITAKVHVNLKESLRPYDRVLVVWLNDHKDPLVLSKVVSS